jgi:hypothetical protein
MRTFPPNARSQTIGTRAKGSGLEGASAAMTPSCQTRGPKATISFSMSPTRRRAEACLASPPGA